MIVNIIAWVVLGAIAGYIAGLLVKGDERWGVIGHVVLGIVGAFVGGFLVTLIPGLSPGAAGGGDVVNIYSILVAVVGAVIVVFGVNFLSRGSRTA